MEKRQSNFRKCQNIYIHTYIQETKGLQIPTRENKENRAEKRYGIK